MWWFLVWLGQSLMSLWVAGFCEWLIVMVVLGCAVGFWCGWVCVVVYVMVEF